MEEWNLKSKSCLVFFYALLISSLYSGCSLDPPEAPSWDTTIIVPLAEKDFTMREMAEDEEILFLEGDALKLSISKDMERFEVGDDLNVDDVNHSFEVGIGDFEVESPGEKSSHPIGIEDIYPNVPFESLMDKDVVIPGVGPDQAIIIERDLTSEKATFEWVRMSSGYVRVTVENHMIVPMGNPETVVLLKSRSDSSTIGKLAFPRIEPEGSRLDSLDVSGKLIPNDMFVEIEFTTPGSEGESVRVTQDVLSGYFVIKVLLSSFTVSEAVAQVPSHSFSTEEVASVEDTSVIVEEALLKSGQIDISISNDIPIGSSSVISSVDVVSPSGDPFMLSVEIPPKGSTSDKIDISGYTVYSAETGSGGSEIRFKVESLTDSTKDMVYLRSEDKVDVSVKLSELKFSKFKGILKELEVDIPVSENEVDVPEGLEGVSLAEAALEMSFMNAIGFPIRFQISLVGEGRGNKTASLLIDDSIPPGNPLSPAQGTISVQGKEVADFLNILPEKVTTSGRALVGDGRQGEVSDNDFIDGIFSISAPMRFILESQSLSVDPDTVEISKDTQNVVRKNLKGGRLIATVDNHLPVGARVKVKLSRVGSGSGPDSVSVSESVLAGEIDGNGRVINASENEINVELDKDELSIFENPEVRVDISVMLSGTDGREVEVVSNDSVRVKARVEIDIEFNREMI